MQWIKIFLLLLFKKNKKNRVEGRDMQYISPCTLNKIGRVTPRVLRSLDASSQGKFPNP